MKQQPDAFDLILMDVQMPGMSGCETTVAIRQQLKLNLPIIALTGGVTEAEREQALQSGMNAFLSKPVDPDKLDETVRDFITSAGTPRPSEQPDRVSGPADGWPPIPGIDTSRLATIFEDDVAFFREVLSLFIAASATTAEELEQRLAQQDYSGAEKLIHKMRGQLANIGAADLSEIARALEQGFGQQQPQNERVQTFCEQLRQLQQAITAALD
ncbi:MAG: response regulator [Desulfuromonadaceae bacterium]|nr:response regulator [Desulfuromonadaceae bacterium]